VTNFYTFITVIQMESQERSPERLHLTHSSNLSCYTCTSIEDIRCKTINETNTHLHNVDSQFRFRLYTECAPGEQYCAVLRLDSKIEQSAIDYKFWAVERKCVKECVEGCFVLGERTKLSLCTTCCSTNYCNVGNTSSERCHILSLFFALSLYLFLNMCNNYKFK